MADTPTRAETVIKAGLSLVPFVGGSLAVIYADFITRRKARVAKMAEAALTRFPNGDEEFVRRMQQDPRLAELFMTGVQAAAATAVDAKAKALGMLLADAASTEDMASYDEKELLVLALADLEWPHIRGLKQLAEFPSDDELRSEMDESAMNESPVRQTRLDVTASLPGPVLAALVRHGLVGQEAGYGLYVSGVSRFGRKLLEYLQEAIEND